MNVLVQECTKCNMDILEHKPSKCDMDILLHEQTKWFGCSGSMHKVIHGQPSTREKLRIFRTRKLKYAKYFQSSALDYSYIVLYVYAASFGECDQTFSKWIFWQKWGVFMMYPLIISWPVLKFFNYVKCWHFMRVYYRLWPWLMCLGDKRNHFHQTITIWERLHEA